VNATHLSQELRAEVNGLKKATESQTDVMKNMQVKIEKLDLKTEQQERQIFALTSECNE